MLGCSKQASPVDLRSSGLRKKSLKLVEWIPWPLVVFVKIWVWGALLVVSSWLLGGLVLLSSVIVVGIEDQLFLFGFGHFENFFIIKRFEWICGFGGFFRARWLQLCCL